MPASYAIETLLPMHAIPQTFDCKTYGHLNRHAQAVGWIGAGLALLFALQISGLWYPTPDASGYLSIGRSLASGHGPMNLGSRQLYLAPAYPVMTALAFWFGDEPFWMISIEHWFLMLAFLAGVYIWLRRHFTSLEAALLTALALANVEVSNLFRRTLSENLFMPLLIWEANFLQAVRARPTIGRIGLATLAMVGLVLTRQAGVTLIAGFGLALAWDVYHGRVRWTRGLGQLALIGLPALVAVVCLARYDRSMAAATGAPTYMDQIADPTASWLGQVLEGVRLRVSEMGRLTIPGMSKAYGRRGEWLNINMAIYAPVAALFVLGWWRWLRQTGDTLALALPFYVLLYIIWPFDQATRFMVPMLPLLAVCGWIVLERLGRRRLQLVGVLVVAHLVAGLGYWLIVDRPRALIAHRQWPVIHSLAQRIDRRSGSVAAIDVPSEQLWMLQFALDRRIVDINPRGTIDPRVRWLIADRKALGFDGFDRREELGQIALWSRSKLSPVLKTKNPLPMSALNFGARWEEGLTKENNCGKVAISWHQAVWPQSERAWPNLVCRGLLRRPPDDERELPSEPRCQAELCPRGFQQRLR